MEREHTPGLLGQKPSESFRALHRVIRVRNLIQCAPYDAQRKRHIDTATESPDSERCGSAVQFEATSP